jgi:hypothetical protein
MATITRKPDPGQAELADRLPPHSVEAEQGVLGCVLLSPGDCMAESIAKLKAGPESFYDVRHQVLFRELVKMSESGNRIDLITLQQHLKDHTLLAQCGGLAYLASLPDAVPSAAGLDYYLDIVVEKYRLRRLAQTAAAIANDASKPGAAPSVICDSIRLALDQFTAADPRQLKARLVGELKAPSPADGMELIRDRFLSRRGGLLLVGQSGQGKSSLVIQMAVSWAIARPCFGIQPARPLRTLIIQAENDDGDLWEMFDGVKRGLQLNEPDRRKVDDGILVHTENALAGQDFLRMVARLAAFHKPDLIIVDPALAYIDGETKDSKAVGDFLRRGLNPILSANNCGAIVLHHTTKQKNDGKSATSDFLYAGLGSVEYTNWARGVLVLETKADNVYALHAPKRGRRIGWPEPRRFIRHTREPHMIFWEDAEAPPDHSSRRSSKQTKTPRDLLALIPTKGTISKSMLILKASESGIGQNKARAFLDELISAGTVHVWLLKRHGTNPEKRIGLQPQPDGPNPK